MKKILTVAALAAMTASLAACGSSKPAETTAAPAEQKETVVTGSADGFGGKVTATVTMADGKVTAVKLEGADETPEVGGKALAELEAQVLAANGPEIDGVSGATITAKAVKKAVAEAMGVSLPEETTEAAKETETAAPAEAVAVEGGIQIGQIYTAAHGTKCFTQAVAVVKDEVILAAFLDEYQFLAAGAEIKGVPNSDADFAQGYAEGVVLASKRENNTYYSQLMKEKANATTEIAAGYDAIQSFAVGKTIAELEEAAGKDNAVDAVSGATLADTANYLKAIAEAAKAAQKTQAVEYAGSTDALKLNVLLGAAHGTKCFSSAAVLTDGEKVILSYLDEFQFMPGDAAVTGVPNSDADFAQGYAEGVVLASKRENNAYYSQLMKEKANSTVELAANYDAIQNAVNGMSIADAEALAGKDNAVDAVSGATLADTAGYVALIAAAAKA